MTSRGSRILSSISSSQSTFRQRHPRSATRLVEGFSYFPRRAYNRQAPRPQPLAVLGAAPSSSVLQRAGHVGDVLNGSSLPRPRVPARSPTSEMDSPSSGPVTPQQQSPEPELEGSSAGPSDSPSPAREGSPDSIHTMVPTSPGPWASPSYDRDSSPGSVSTMVPFSPISSGWGSPSDDRGSTPDSPFFPRLSSPSIRPKSVRFLVDEEGANSDADIVEIRHYDKSSETDQFIPHRLLDHYDVPSMSDPEWCQWPSFDRPEEAIQARFCLRYGVPLNWGRRVHGIVLRSFDNDIGNHFEVKDARTNLQSTASWQGGGLKRITDCGLGSPRQQLRTCGSVDEMYPSDQAHHNCEDCKELQAAGGIDTGHRFVRCAQHEVDTPYRHVNKEYRRYQDTFWMVDD